MMNFFKDAEFLRDMKSKESLLFVCVFFVTASLLVSEMLSMRAAVLAFGMRYEFFIIPLAILGMGVGGVLASLLRLRGGKRVELLYPALAYPIPALTPFFLAYIAHTTGYPKTLQIAFFAAGFVSYAIAGWIVATILKYKSRSVTFLYGFDLIGAASGVVCTILALNLFGFGGTVIILGVLSLAPIVLLSGYFSRRTPAAVSATFTALVVTAVCLYILVPTHVSCGKQPLFYQGSNAYSDVQIVNGEATWRQYITEDAGLTSIPPSVSVFNIGFDCFALNAMLLSFSSWDDVQFLELGLRSIPFAFLHVDGKRPSSGLILGSGGGPDIVRARFFGLTQIDATELNPLVVEATHSVSDSFSDPYKMEGVAVHIMDSRRFISTTRNEYDIILDAKTKGPGAHPFNGVVTDYAVTAEAMRSYIEHLKPYGIYANVVRAIRGIPTYDRKLATVLYALGEMGFDAADRVAIIYGSKDAGDLILVRREPFTEHDKKTLARVASERGFYRVEFGIDSDVREAMAASAQVATDDNPVVYNFSGGKAGDATRDQVVTGLLQPLAVAVVILLMVIVLGTRILTAAPSYAMNVASYFSALGFGLVCFEIALIQKFDLILADPSYSIAVTLFSILFFGGLGSVCATLLSKKRSAWVFILLFASFLACIMLLLSFGKIVSDILIPYPLFWRMLGVTGMLMIPSFLAGIFFPLGIKRIQNASPNMAPWAWGVGGVAGVIGGLTGKILSFQYGITVTLYAVMCAYAIACLSFIYLHLHGSEKRSSN